jgi:hypothetical protein
MKKIPHFVVPLEVQHGAAGSFDALGERAGRIIGGSLL